MTVAIVDIAALLNTSRLAHDAYREAVPHKRAIGGQITDIAGDTARAYSALQQAYDSRLMAEQADPQHTDRAWLDDLTDSADLLAFYRTQLGL